MHGYAEDVLVSLFQLGDAERNEAIGRLAPEARAVASAMTYLGVRPRAKWEDDIFEWQAWLKPCMDEGILDASEDAAALHCRLGLRPIGLDRKDPQRVEFEFIRTKDLVSVVAAYWDCSLSVDANSYFSSIRFLKNRLYSPE